MIHIARSVEFNYDKERYMMGAGGFYISYQEHDARGDEHIHWYPQTNRGKDYDVYYQRNIHIRNHSIEEDLQYPHML